MKKFLQKFKNKKGMTLIELVIAVAIFTILMGAVIAVYTTSMRDFVETKTVDETNDSIKLQIVLDKFLSASDPDGDGIKEIDGYKVEEIKYSDMDNMKLTDAAGNEVVDLSAGKTEKYYRVTAPNGKILYVTYG